MDIVSRVQGIIVNPKSEWEKIKTEEISIKELFISYAMILAAVPAVAQFIGLGLVGKRIPFVGWYRYGIGSAFIYMILSYILALAAVYVTGIVINALAPTFGSTQNTNKAMSLAVFSMTPLWVAGILYVIPFLSILVFLGGLYGLYVLYTGFASGIMATPKEKVLGYFIVSLIVNIILWFVISAILGAIFAVGAVSGVY
ncbi:MAG: Yip1 family protein [Acidobacteriota bacterium]